MNNIAPAPNTQAARLLAALLQGLRVDPLTAWRTLGIYRLSDTVFNLRHMGWPIVTDRLDVKNRFGETCHVALYSLNAEDIAQAGDAGQQFAAHVQGTTARREAA